MRNILILAVVVGLAVTAFVWNRTEKTGDSASAGAAMTEVSVPRLDGQALAGQEVYGKFCAACHGASAAGQVGVAPPLIHKIYEPSHHGDMAFVLAARRGVQSHHWPFGDMPPVADITDEELGQVIAYIRTLQQANGIY
ncbi:MAG: cytochrome c [Rhodobacteraceae bacterium]|nr:cytochrome c [Paracoccaceae bacterium]